MQPAQFPTHVIGYELCKKIPTTTLWVLGSLLPPQENYKFRTPPLPLGKMSSIMHAFPTTSQDISFKVLVFLHLLYRLLPGISSQLLCVKDITVNISKLKFKDIYFIVCRSLILTAVILVPVPTVDSEIEVNIESGDTTCISHTLILME